MGGLGWGHPHRHSGTLNLDHILLPGMSFVAKWGTSAEISLARTITWLCLTSGRLGSVIFLMSRNERIPRYQWKLVIPMTLSFWFYPFKHFTAILLPPQVGTGTYLSFHLRNRMVVFSPDNPLNCILNRYLGRWTQPVHSSYYYKALFPLLISFGDDSRYKSLGKMLKSLLLFLVHVFFHDISET